MMRLVPAAKNASALDDAFIAVRQQVLVDHAKQVALGDKIYLVAALPNAPSLR